MQPTNYLRTAVILSALHISTMCTSKPVILGAGGNNEPQTNTPCSGNSADRDSPEPLVAVNQEHPPIEATASIPVSTALTPASTAPIPVSTVPTASPSTKVHGEEIKTPAPTPVSKKEPPKQLSVQHSTLRDHEEKKEDPIPKAWQVNPFCGSQDVFTNKLLSFLKIDEIVHLRLVDKVTCADVDSATNNIIPKFAEVIGEYKKAGKDYIKDGAYEEAFKNPDGDVVRSVMEYEGKGLGEDLRKDFMEKFVAYVKSKEGSDMAKAVMSLKKVVAKKRCLLGYIKNSLGALSQKQRYEIILAAVKGHAWALSDIGGLSNYDLTGDQQYEIWLAAVKNEVWILKDTDPNFRVFTPEQRYNILLAVAKDEEEGGAPIVERFDDLTGLDLTGDQQYDILKAMAEHFSSGPDYGIVLEYANLHVLTLAQRCGIFLIALDRNPEEAFRYFDHRNLGLNQGEIYSKLLAAINKDPWVLRHVDLADRDLTGDQRYGMLLAAVNKDHRVLRDIGSLSNYGLTGDQRYGILLAAVTQNGYALRYASDALKNDSRILLAAVTQNGDALHLASEALRNDREIVLAAVSKAGLALRYASAALRNDREIVLAAVMENGCALEHASETLQNDPKIALAAVENTMGGAIDYVSETLKNDPRFMLSVARINPFAANLGVSSNLRKEVDELRTNRGVSVEDALATIVAGQAVEEKKADIVIE